MSLGGEGGCSCLESFDPAQPSIHLMPDGSCGDVCPGEDAQTPERYCGGPTTLAVYRIKAPAPAPRPSGSIVVDRAKHFPGTDAIHGSSGLQTSQVPPTLPASPPSKAGEWVAGVQSEILKAISYAPVPLKSPRDPLRGKPLPDDDFMSSDTSALWGPKGRHDLRTIRALGANGVRLYGNDPSLNHKEFLDEAMAQGLRAITGISDYPYTQMGGNCLTTKLNCYSQVKKAYLENLRNGFLDNKTRRYHPALRTVILINEPDLKFQPVMSPEVFCKPLVSAFDAVIDAEREMGVVGPAPNFTVTFSFGICRGCPVHGESPAVGQMAALLLAMKDPSTVGYAARNNLWSVYKARWENSVNTANPAKGPGGFKDLFLDVYQRVFRSVPVFIGEYHAPDQVDQEQDLNDILSLAGNNSTLLAGISFFEFQVRYDKGGDEMRFGMFGLGDRSLGSFRIATETSQGNFSAWCLTPMVAASETEQCGRMEHGIRYRVLSTWGYDVKSVPSPELCCAKCGESTSCRSWVWKAHAAGAAPDPCPGRCWLYGEAPAHRWQVVDDPDCVSGLPPEGSTPEFSNMSPNLLSSRVAKAFSGRGLDYSSFCPAAGVVLLHVPPDKVACR